MLPFSFFEIWVSSAIFQGLACVVGVVEIGGCCESCSGAGGNSDFLSAMRPIDVPFKGSEKTVHCIFITVKHSIVIQGH
jgi:hypothetical protein